MTKVTFHRGLPVIDRDSFLTPFDRMFDEIVGNLFLKSISRLELIHSQILHIQKSTYMNTMIKLA